MERPPLNVTITENGCWITTTVRPFGNGYIYLEKRVNGVRNRELAHIASYEALIGPVPSGCELHHKCENKLCLNPWHLIPATKADHLRLHALSKTHCRNGHEYTEENIYRRFGTGPKECRTCRKSGMKRHKSNRKSIKNAG